MMMMMRNSMPATMQESFGCSVTNRFMQLLDDESDPFDILREAEEEKRKKKKKEEATAAKKGGGGGGAAKTSKKESQRDRRMPLTESGWTGPAGGENSLPQQQPGQKRGFKKGEQQGLNEYRGAEIKMERTERRPVFREQRNYEVEGSTEFGIERPVDRLDRDRPMRGRGGGRGGMRGRGRGGGPPRNMDGFDQRGKRDFERHSGSDRTGIRPEDKRGGSGAHNWGTVKDDLSEIEQTTTTATTEEPAETETQEVPGDAENKGTGDGEPVEETQYEMTLDEWKMLQQQSRPKAEFNIRKPDASVLKKAVVIHKSKFKDGQKIEDEEEEEEDDDHHFFRRPVNDITSKLDINFGNLPRPGRGGRGRGRGRGRDRRISETRPEIVPEMPQVTAPDPYDPEAFPALA